MTGSTTTPGGDRVTSLVPIRNKKSENPNNFVVLSVEHGCGGCEEDVLSQSPSGKVIWFQRNWKAITSDQWVLNCVQGYEIEWVARPSRICTPRELVFPKAGADCLSAEIERLLQKDGVSPVCPPFNETTSEHGFVSQLFAVSKKDGGIRPVVNLKALNSHVQ